ncbi:hypothetical protein D3C74_25220 [compost metagenome]
MNVKKICNRLREHGVQLTEGLTQDEIQLIETTYQIDFPPDLKELLQHVLPSGDKFPNWRDFTKTNIHSLRTRLKWPLDGMLFDVEHNDFWHPSWGSKPDNIAAAKEICIHEYRSVPRLIPIYSHRYIPSTPAEAGNPVFSVYQTDIIYYGENLEEYLKLEFGDKPYNAIDFDRIKPITFWTELAEG